MIFSAPSVPLRPEANGRKRAGLRQLHLTQGCRVQGLNGAGFRAKGSGFRGFRDIRVQGIDGVGFRAKGSGFRGFRVIRVQGIDGVGFRANG